MGEPAVAEVQQGQEVGQPELPGLENQNTEPQVKKAPSAEELIADKARLEERYKHSSEEGIRLNQEVKKLREDLEKTRSLTGNNNSPLAPQLPDEDSIVSYKMTQVGMDERAARHAAKVELGLLAQQRAMQVQLQALQNQMRFQNEQSNRLAMESNPLLKEAESYFADWPEMKLVSPAEKIERYRKVKPNVSTTITGRDTSAIKGQAGSPAGSGSGSRGGNVLQTELEKTAKDMGLSSSAELADLQRATDQDSYDAYKKKWKK